MVTCIFHTILSLFLLLACDTPGTYIKIESVHVHVYPSCVYLIMAIPKFVFKAWHWHRSSAQGAFRFEFHTTKRSTFKQASFTTLYEVKTKQKQKRGDWGALIHSGFFLDSSFPCSFNYFSYTCWKYVTSFEMPHKTFMDLLNMLTH